MLICKIDALFLAAWNEADAQVRSYFLQICVKFLTNLWKISPTKFLRIFESLI
jgi:hypothetical protein